MPETAITAVCPEYAPALKAFSDVVNDAAVQVARALDHHQHSLNASSSAESLAQLLSSAEHLDHFHAYSSPAHASNVRDDSTLSLDLHTDNGVVIFMTTPAFYALSGSKKPTRVARDAIVSGPNASAGLLIQPPNRPDSIVQPILHDDELIVMIGEGFRSWLPSKLSTRLQLPAVVHGMQMPSFSPSLGQTSRSWFGKMLLFPKDRVMRNTGMTFGEYATRATKYVVGVEEDSSRFSSVACPPASKLVASDSSCALQVFAPKRGSDATKQQCTAWCNSSHGAIMCRAKCEYVATLPSGGIDCWMLCLPTTGCPAGQTAVCSPDGEQKTVCVMVNTTSFDSIVSLPEVNSSRSLI
ncbi:hypothetical protein PINS_up012045 [Pythium insidiosum]|nr:hypothetical protein PINS_up012045 [Pythium insidiosum]